MTCVHCMRASPKMHRGSWFVCAVLACIVVARAQTPAPTPTDPLALTGDLISETTSMSCDDIFVGDPDSDGTTESLSCNKASVLMLQVPLKETDENGITFDFAPNGQSGGGSYHTPPNQCEKGPGYCLYGQAFRINIRVSVVATAFDLTFMHIVSPFAYSYENCLSLAPATDKTFYPYYAEGTCGPADIWDWNDYRTCTDKRAWPYFFRNQDSAYSTGYSDCAFMCGWELEKQTQELAKTPSGPTIEQWCNDDARTHRVDTYDYMTNAVTPLACSKATALTPDVQQNLLPNFPLPTGFCPCAGSATTVDPSSTPPPTGSEAPPVGPYSSIVGCKSCAGAGACGTALPRPEPTDTEAQCKDTDSDIDTVCDCVPGDGNSVGGFDGTNDPVNDPNTVCFNTGQRHRCLKCQPVMTTDPNSGNQNDYPENCAYTDLNQYAFCNTFWMDVCGNGDYTLADRQRDNSKTDASITMCNCKGVFIERAYWVAPFCSPYRIVNPGKLQYIINVTLLYGGDPNGTLYNTPVPNGTMTIGAGYSPFVDPGDPPNVAGQVLAWLNATVDGFAVSEIESEYTKSGGYTTNLPGAIVMCNNGKGTPQYCGFTTTNNTNVGAVPTADIRTAGRTGLNNPWPDVSGTGPPIVPLPDFIYNTSGAGDINANNGQWWYYLTQEELDTYGIGCGQNGWRIVGSADTASSYTMCNNLQGTCVPGIDRQFRGEAIKPPCSVAVDFLNYVTDPNNSPDTDTGKAVNPADPDHVPPGWNNQNPQYAVHRGKLFWYNDPVVTSGEAAVRLRISVAADFKEETVVQAGGTISVTTPPDCTISTQDLLGSFYVNVTNKGTMAAEYQFTAGECTAGLDFKPQIFSIKPGSTGTVIRLAISGSTSYGSAEEPAGQQSCSVVMTPSLAPSLILGTTDVIPCTPVYGLPDIVPILSANTSYEEGLADTFIINYVNSGTCSSWFCDIWNPHFHNQFFTPLEWTIITFFFTVFIFALTIFAVLCIGRQVTEMENRQAAYRETILKRERGLEARIAAA